MASENGISGFSLTRIAPAKINLALHVVGQRADGYHLLESLVTFADAGDRIGLSLSDEDRFTISGRFSADLQPDSDGAAGNLVLKARDILRAYLAGKGIKTGPVHLHLEKNLPVASGIGGGSADAAATLLGLLEVWQTSVHIDSLMEMALQLGADVPMCLSGTPLIARGIGEDIERFAEFPSFPMLIVNPLKAVSTPTIFQALKSKLNPPLTVQQEYKERPLETTEWLDAIAEMRNDLEPAALAIEPEIAVVNGALNASGAHIKRMSGSGASCFAIYDTIAERDAAALTISQQHPGWYVLSTESTPVKSLKSPWLRAQFIDFLEGLADHNYQIENWQVLHENAKRYDELDYTVHFLYDDTELSRDAKSCVGEILYDADEVKAVEQIIASLDAVFDRYGLTQTDRDYINTPEWVSVVKTAANAIPLFRANGVGSFTSPMPRDDVGRIGPRK